MRIVLLLIALGTSRASAQPAATADDTEPFIHWCVPAYGEGHLLVGARSGPAYVPEVVITRWSLGLRLCTQVGDLQLGVVFDSGIDTSDGHPVYSGRGVEARPMFDLPVPNLRLGPHLAVTGFSTATASNTALWFGARLERDPIVFGFDIVRIPGAEREAAYDVWGFYGSIGLRGWPGLIGFAAVSTLWLGNIFLNEHGS
jgi:hypothetical protein